MYMRDIWASLARRWILVLVCLLATAGLGYMTAQKVPPTYQSTADMVLVPPKSTLDPKANRYLSLGGLRQAVDVLTRSVGSDSTDDAIRLVAPEGKFETSADFTTSAPILIVTASADTPLATQKLLDAVLAQVPVNLRELQKSVQIDPKYQITPQMVAQDDEPKTVMKTQIRAVGAVVALSLLVSAMLVGAVDNRLVRRANSKKKDTSPVEPVRNAKVAAAGPAVKRPAQKKSGPVPRKPNVVSPKVRR